MENQQYTEEFKQSIVNLYKSGKSSTLICKEYGMSSSTLHKWIKKYTGIKVSDTETLTMAEIKNMQKKFALLKEENLILKKLWPFSQRNSRTDKSNNSFIQSASCQFAMQSIEGGQKCILQLFKAYSKQL